MRERPNDAEVTSRRKFTKLVATALAVTPLASLLSCNKKPERINPGDGGEIPPIIIKDGSMDVELTPTFFNNLNAPDDNGNGHRKWKYRTDLDLKFVKLVTEKGTGGEYSFLNATGEVKIWLQSLKSASPTQPTWEPSNFSSDSYDISIQSGRIEVNSKYKFRPAPGEKQNTYKMHRPLRLQPEGFGAFHRIGKVEVVNGGITQAFMADDVGGFMILIWIR